MLELGTQAPAFSLPDADGAMHSLDDAAGNKAYLVMFICNHCPFVKHVPDDGPAAMKAESASRGYGFPYVLDADQSIAKAYRAACTPDFYLFDANRVLVYRGQLDGSRPGNDVPVDGRDLRAAIDTVLAGEPVPEDQLPSLGCRQECWCS